MTDQPTIRRVVGVMTGTSLDGIDVVLVKIEGQGLAMRATLERHVSHDLGDVGDRLRALAAQRPMSAGEIARITWGFGELHVQAIAELIGEGPADQLPADESPDEIDLIVVHGQTVFHEPPYSWQLINAAPIVERFGATVMSELRQADIAAGGQGAPITPLADWIMFGHPTRSRSIINLGGFCNVTLLPARGEEPVDHNLAAVRGADVCACNLVLNAAARAVLDRPFDRDSAAASDGKPDVAATRALELILFDQSRGQRSLGTGDEAGEWIEEWQEHLSAPDLLASCTAAVGKTIAGSDLVRMADEIVLAGGGTRHRLLAETIGSACGKPTADSAAHGYPIDAREAMAMAILGALSADGVPITLPHITGCRTPAPIAGHWRVPR